MDLPEAYHLNGQIPELKGLVLRKCPQDEARKIDLVLLSIGGNDIGFSRLLANAVLSNESLLRELGGWLGEVHGEAEASAELDHLGARYKSLNRALHNILYVPWEESDRILLVAYPGLALEGDGSETCGTARPAWKWCPISSSSGQQAEARHVVRRQAAPARCATAPMSTAGRFVETHRRAFIGRGICAGLSVEGVSEVDDLRLPRKIDGMWTPYNPADYQPYASRQRWFRTPNDAFMTGNFHVAAGLLTKVLEDRAVRAVPARVGVDLFRRLPSDGRRTGRDRRCGRRQGARGAREIRRKARMPIRRAIRAVIPTMLRRRPSPSRTAQIPDVKSVLTVPHDAHEHRRDVAPALGRPTDQRRRRPLRNRLPTSPGVTRAA